MQRLTCQHCKHDVFFENTHCLNCGFTLGYAPRAFQMLASDNGLTFEADGATKHACVNRDIIACNWLTDTVGTLCEACRHNQVIPDLSISEHVTRWARIEKAKRVLFYSLIAWQLPLAAKAEEPETGLAFDFLADEQLPDGTLARHTTGHAEGLITINIAEGDDVERERRRQDLGEPYRTLVGHFRHEIGHYYFDRLVVPDVARLAKAREIFGDERADYQAALERHYQAGPPSDWRNRFISGYAASHPFEDFAETFAHYIHMVDGLETAAAFGVEANHEHPIPSPYSEGTVDELIEAWVPVTVAVNAVNRSMGQPDLYPFVLSEPVYEKLGFVHEVMRPEVKRERSTGLFGSGLFSRGRNNPLRRLMT